MSNTQLLEKIDAAIAGRNLQYYRYDGQGIKGTKEELIRCMESVRVEAVEAALRRFF